MHLFFKNSRGRPDVSNSWGSCTCGRIPSQPRFSTVHPRHGKRLQHQPHSWPGSALSKAEVLSVRGTAVRWLVFSYPERTFRGRSSRLGPQNQRRKPPPSAAAGLCPTAHLPDDTNGARLQRKNVCTPLLCRKYLLPQRFDVLQTHRRFSFS